LAVAGDLTLFLRDSAAARAISLPRIGRSTRKSPALQTEECAPHRNPLTIAATRQARNESPSASALDALGSRRSVDVTRAFAITTRAGGASVCRVKVSSVRATTRPTSPLTAGVVAETRATSPSRSSPDCAESGPATPSAADARMQHRGIWHSVRARIGDLSQFVWNEPVYVPYATLQTRING